MMLSILIPAHNEQTTIKQVIEAVFAVNLGGWDREVVVVNDGSTDKTLEILNTLQSSFNFKLIKHEKNKGKGEAIKSGLKEVTGEYVIIQDADMEYFPESIPSLLNALPPHPNPCLPDRQALPLHLRQGYGGQEGEREFRVAVFGNRGTKRYPERGFHYVVGAKLLTWFFNILFFCKVKDLYTGYKVIPTKLLKSFNLNSSGFEFEAEVSCKIVKAGYKIIEVPIKYLPRSKENGKHIRIKDAFVGFWTILKYRVK